MSSGTSLLSHRFAYKSVDFLNSESRLSSPAQAASLIPPLRSCPLLPSASEVCNLDVSSVDVSSGEAVCSSLLSHRVAYTGSHGFGWPEAWSVPGPLDTRRDLETRMSERDVLLTTGSVGQKPGRHLDHWVRGGIKTNAGPKDMCGFPRSRLAGSLAGTWAIRNAEGLRKRPAKRDARLPTGSVGQSMAGTWAVGHAEGLTQTPVRKRWQAPQWFGWPEAWSAPGPLDTRRESDKRWSERDARLPTGSVGQKPGRYLGHWIRGEI